MHTNNVIIVIIIRYKIMFYYILITYTLSFFFGFNHFVCYQSVTQIYFFIQYKPI